MPRKPRVEFEGATYHVMCRGNRQAAVFRDDRDNEMFLDTLGEACVRCGWRVHAFVLMGNHYHLLLETPEPNLVAGMQWLQGTYTKRFNVRHKEWGHLFQGRYKALPVGGSGDYFATVATYIHLNPARTKGYDFENTRLDDYVWSSYPGYVWLKKRPEWLCTERVLGAWGLSDTPAGRRSFRAAMERRVLEMQHSSEPWKVDEAWNKIRRGWCFGDEGFRKELIDRLGEAMESGQSDSFSGAEVREHGTAEAERLVHAGLQALGIKESDLDLMIKSSPEKYAIAWLVRKNTCVRNGWIKERLKMGSATNFSDYLHRIENAKEGDWGHAELKHIRVIEL